MPPAITTMPSQNFRTARTKAKGLTQPVCPPAPAVSSTSPSTPAATAFSAWRTEATSASTRQPESFERLQHRLGRADAGDHHLGLVAQHGRRDRRAPAGWSGARSGWDRAARRTAGLVGGALKVVAHVGQPAVELLDRAAVGGRERADDAGAAGAPSPAPDRRPGTSAPRSAAGAGGSSARRAATWRGAYLSAARREARSRPSPAPRRRCGAAQSPPQARSCPARRRRSRWSRAAPITGPSGRLLAATR